MYPNYGEKLLSDLVCTNCGIVHEEELAEAAEEVNPREVTTRLGWGIKRMPNLEVLRLNFRASNDSLSANNLYNAFVLQHDDDDDIEEPFFPKLRHLIFHGFGKSNFQAATNIAHAIATARDFATTGDLLASRDLEYCGLMLCQTRRILEIFRVMPCLASLRFTTSDPECEWEETLEDAVMATSVPEEGCILLSIYERERESDGMMCRTILGPVDYEEYSYILSNFT